MVRTILHAGSIAVIAVAAAIATLGCSSGAPNPLPEEPGTALPRWTTRPDRETTTYVSQRPDSDEEEGDAEPDDGEGDAAAGADPAGPNADLADDVEAMETPSSSGLPGENDPAVDLGDETPNPVGPVRLTAIGTATVTDSTGMASAESQAAEDARAALRAMADVRVRRALMLHIDASPELTQAERRSLRARVWSADFAGAFDNLAITLSDPSIDRDPETKQPIAVYVQAEVGFGWLVPPTRQLAGAIFGDDLATPSDTQSIRLLAANGG